MDRNIGENQAPQDFLAKLMQNMPELHVMTKYENFDSWFLALSVRSGTVRFEHSFDSQAKLQTSRAIRRHSGMNCLMLVALFKFRKNSSFTGSSKDYRSVALGGLLAGGNSNRRGREACFYSAINPLENKVPAV